jgi:hypothetical protein
MRYTLGTALFIVLSIFLLVHIISPPEWDYFDGFIAHLISGIATRNIISQTPLGFAYLTPLFTWLTSHIGLFPWVGLISQAMLLAANAVFVFITLHLFRQKFPHLPFWKIVPPACLLFFIIQLPANAKPSFTGLTFLLCGSAVLLIEKFVSEAKDYRQKIMVYLIAIFMYGWGACMRFDTPLAAAGIAGTYILLSSGNLKKSILSMVPLLIV